MKSSPDPLDPALAAWRVTPPRNSQFRGQVWDRIKGARSISTWWGYARTHATMLAVTFAFATALGAFTGRLRARADTQAESGRLATAYVQSLDARTMRMP